MTDPYLSGLVSENPFHKKLPVSGSIAAVLSLKYDKRGMKLMPQRSSVHSAPQNSEYGAI